ncbi:HDOD domain-containing protein [Geomesophilobacter sediminis]|uniref:HDOD domain-containing protein n=1 Tax=Geomesophilobacter sediminis TaxID=2798584 RepID=A0A8J7M1U4_9BACT|nr:HDOD domain-containing protein [Geomesophilobacter sediminis]MBJ6726858.1 HDOD domain-containing protein [Geomesophilobacter sediminis]
MSHRHSSSSHGFHSDTPIPPAAVFSNVTRLRQAGPPSGDPTGKRSIIDQIRSRIDSRAICVPVLPAVARQIQRLLSRPDFPEHQVILLAGADPGLATKLLKEANSPFFRGLTPVGTVEEAFQRLGSTEALGVVRQTIREDVFAPGVPRLDRIMQSLWSHSFCCAVASGWLARRAGFTALAQDAFLAGLFHDVGKLFLLRLVEGLEQRHEVAGMATEALLAEVFDALHAEEGHRLLREWSIPESLAEVVRDHDRDDWNELNPLLAIVRLANLACRVCGVGPRSDPSLLLIGTTEAHVLGVKEVILAEMEVVIEDAALAPMSALREML